MEIRDRILERIEELGTTARAVSLKAGLNAHFLQKYLTGLNKSMRVDNLRELAEALEVSPEWLLTGKKDVVEPEIAEVVGLMGRIRDRDLRKDIVDYVKWKTSKGD